MLGLVQGAGRPLSKVLTAKVGVTVDFGVVRFHQLNDERSLAHSAISHNSKLKRRVRSMCRSANCAHLVLRWSALP